ncbi:hypothetical protein ACFL13_01620 [Patescibacteria group bacterium]
MMGVKNKLVVGVGLLLILILLFLNIGSLRSRSEYKELFSKLENECQEGGLLFYDEGVLVCDKANQEGISPGEIAVVTKKESKGYPTGCLAGQAVRAIGDTLTCFSVWDDISDLPLASPSDGDSTHLSSAGQIFDWITGKDYISNDSSISKDDLKDKGNLDFNWDDGEISNSITVGSSGSVDWTALTSYPTGCSAGQAVRVIGDTLTCIDVADSSVNWTVLTSYPTGCSAGQAVRVIGDTLTCIDVGDTSLWTDDGAVTYLTSTTNDIAIGGSDSTAPFYLDVGSSLASITSLRVGDTSNYLDISSSGHLTLAGSATVWDDVRVPITGVKTGGSKIPGFVKFKDDGGGSQGVFSYQFDPDQEEEVYFTVQLPHSYKAGSDIEPHIHWTPIDGNSGSVIWGLEYTWANYEGTFSDTTIVTKTQAASGTAYEHQIADFAAISGTGQAESSMLICRVYRDATDGSDDYGSDVALLEIDFHFQIEKMGTDDEYPS